MSTQTSLPQREEWIDSAEWRDQVADRLKAHRARKRHAAATMSLDFDSAESAPESSREELKKVRAERRDAARAQIMQAAGQDFHSPGFQSKDTMQIPQETAAEICELAEAVLDAFAEPEPDLSAYANVIEFPGRLSAAPEATEEVAITEGLEEQMQLRIFDADIAESPLGGTRWAGLRLDDDPHAQAETHARPEFELPLQVAPLAKRMMCHAIDAMVLVVACVVFFAGAILITGGAPQGRSLLIPVVIAPLLLWTLYQCTFLALGRSTPGMNYARLGICNFQDGYASRGQRLGRAFAGVLSLISGGMGYLWVFIDEDALGWHDRMTRTYLRELAGSDD